MPYWQSVLLEIIIILMNQSVIDIKQFGRFDVDLTNRIIKRRADSAEVKVSKSEVLIFTYLAENKDKTIHRENLLKECWQGKVVTNNSLTVAIKNLRTALNEIDENNLIITEPKLGYAINGANLTHSVLNDLNDNDENLEIQALGKNPPANKQEIPKKNIDITLPSKNHMVTLLFLFITYFIGMQYFSFIDEKTINGIPVIYDGIDLPNPVVNTIKQNQADGAAKWIAYPISGICSRYQLYGVIGDNFIDYSDKIKQGSCDVS